MTEPGGSDDVSGGLMALADQFAAMARNAEELHGENEVAFEDLFSEQFIQQHTDVTSFEAFVERSQWTVDSTEQFEAIPGDEFDEYVSNNSEFGSWESMLERAGTDWVAREIGLR